jgi:hypothetical protein
MPLVLSVRQVAPETRPGTDTVATQGEEDARREARFIRSTQSNPGLAIVSGKFVRADGTRLPSFQDGPGDTARFRVPEGVVLTREGSGTPERLLLGPLQVCTFSRLPCHQTFHRLQETAWESVKGLTAWEGVERREEKVPCRLGVSSRSDCMGVCSRECV